MIVRKKVRMSRTTGGVISEEIIEKVEMSQDEYWKPFMQIMGPEIIKEVLRQAS